MTRKATFEVTVEVPNGVTMLEMRHYLKDAITNWGGRLRPPRWYDDDPGDPLFYAFSKPGSLKVKTVKKGHNADAIPPEVLDLTRRRLAGRLQYRVILLEAANEHQNSRSSKAGHF